MHEDRLENGLLWGKYVSKFSCIWMTSLKPVRLLDILDQSARGIWVAAGRGNTEYAISLAMAGKLILEFKYDISDLSHGLEAIVCPLKTALCGVPCGTIIFWSITDWSAFLLLKSIWFVPSSCKLLVFLIQWTFWIKLARCSVMRVRSSTSTSGKVDKNSHTSSAQALNPTRYLSQWDPVFRKHCTEKQWFCFIHLGLREISDTVQTT